MRCVTFAISTRMFDANNNNNNNNSNNTVVAIQVFFSPRNTVDTAGTLVFSDPMSPEDSAHHRQRKGYEEPDCSHFGNNRKRNRTYGVVVD